VLGALAGLVGTWQAGEALKLVLGIGEPLIGRLLLLDALGARTREVRFDRDPACAICGDAPSIVDAVLDEAGDREARIDGIEEIEPERLDERLRDAVLLDVREPHEIALGALEGSILIPASVLEARMHELDTARRYVVACRIGVKSRWAAGRLRDAGFGQVAHLRGGLLGYAALRDEFEVF
jgi:adenylyltransferase/sulfurtransferase